MNIMTLLHQNKENMIACGAFCPAIEFVVPTHPNPTINLSTEQTRPALHTHFHIFSTV